MDFGTIRSIKNDLILSPSLPRLAVRYSPDFIYLGDLQYIARDTYHVEAFIFITPSSIGHATRLLLVQFQGFLENREGSYEFLPQPVVVLDGEEYQYERYFLNLENDFTRFPGSDLAHAADYIRQRAYTLAGDMIHQRFQRLVSLDGRNLLSISYLEANDDPNMTAERVDADPRITSDLQARALGSFSILREPQ